LEDGRLVNLGAGVPGESGVASRSAGFATAVQNAVVAGGRPKVNRRLWRESLLFMGP